MKQVTLAFAAALLLSASASAQDYSKIVMIGTPTADQMSAGNADDDEQAAYKWFMSHAGAKYISAADLAAGKASLSGEQNAEMGWSHTYSIPREWTLDSNNNLVQKPYAGLSGLRGANQAEKTDATLSNSSVSMGQGRAIELDATFSNATGTYGFTIFDNGRGGKMTISIDPASKRLTVDQGALPKRYGYVDRLSHTFESLGATTRLHVFVDHSIVDIFVDDKYASSVRVFPADHSGTECTAFCNGQARAKLGAYKLESEEEERNTGATSITSIDADIDAESDGTVYNLQGMPVSNPRRGIYIVGGKKVVF